MSRALISLLALAVCGGAIAQSSPLEALEMDVLNAGEEPEQALERMSNRPRPVEEPRVPADAAALEERPNSRITATSFGSAPLNPIEPPTILPGEPDGGDRGDSGDKEDGDKDNGKPGD